MKGRSFMINKGRMAALLAAAATLTAQADPTIGSIWGHAGGMASVSTAGQSSMYSDPLAHSVGDLVTIVVDLQNQITKAQNTTTSKDTAVSAIINSLLYPNDNTNKGFNFLNYHGQNPTASWTGSQSFNGGGTVNNQETASTTIQARVVGVLPNGVLQVEARRFSKAGDEDTAMTLTGLVRPEDLSALNTISSSMVADLQILQKGKGTITNDQRKGWFTKLYEFLEPF
jgi:flagellar L-ring protein precursor FlgH